jgi:hypothetical protein
MLVIRRSVAVVVISSVLGMRVVVMAAAFIVRAAARLHIPRHRIGEVDMMMCVFHAIFERNIGLAREHDGKRHAHDRDRTSTETELRPVQVARPSAAIWQSTRTLARFPHPATIWVLHRREQRPPRHALACVF